MTSPSSRADNEGGLETDNSFCLSLTSEHSGSTSPQENNDHIDLRTHNGETVETATFACEVQAKVITENAKTGDSKMRDHSGETLQAGTIPLKSEDVVFTELEQNNEKRLDNGEKVEGDTIGWKLVELMMVEEEKNTGIAVTGQEEEMVHVEAKVKDMAVTDKEKERSSYLIMLGNIASDLDTLLTDLYHVSKQQEKEGLPCTTGTTHSADTSGKDSFFSSAGNASRRQEDVISSEHSLVSSSDEWDSVDSGHDGRCRSGPSPLVFNPQHFGPRFHQCCSPLTATVEVSPSMDELRPISTVERLIKTNSIWLLSTLSRAGAVHLLKDRETGNFIVRKSSQPNSLALSVQSRLHGHSTVDHYLIEGTNYGYRLQGSAHFFHSIPTLIAYYVENIDEIPYHLKLPSAIQQALSTRELASLDMLGQDFWVSQLSRKSHSPEPMSGLLHKSCSEPINIQRPKHMAVASQELAQNTVPSKSASDFSYFMKTQIEMERYFEQHIQDDSTERLDIDVPGQHGHSAPQHIDSKAHKNLVPFKSQTNKAPPSGGTIISEKIQTFSNSFISQKILKSGPTTATSCLHNIPLVSESKPRDQGEESWVLPSTSTSPQRQKQLYCQEAQDEDIYRSNPSNQPAPVGQSTLGEKLKNHSESCPTETQHLYSEEVVKDRAWTHPGHAPVKAKANLYFTTNLDLLEIPENSYFTSNLSDKLSDYEDIWRNSCCESEADRSDSRMIHDPRSVFDAKVSNHNKNSAKEGKRKVFRKTTRDSPPTRRIVPTGRDAVTGGTTPLSALEQARIIAGCTSEDELILPVAHVLSIQRMETMFDDKPVPLKTSLTKATDADVSDASKAETHVSTAHVNNIHLSSNPPHQITFTTSHSVDFSPPESQDNSSDITGIKSLPLNSYKETSSTCVFTPTMSVIMSESASSEQSGGDRKNKKPSPLSRMKSSSESSLATVSSPLYAEPADAVKLRDKNGRAINIQVRRRSAPNVKIKEKTGKIPSDKVSQNPQLDTIFSPDVQKTGSNVPLSFSFETSNLLNQSETSNVVSKTKVSSCMPPNLSQSVSLQTANEVSQLQWKQSWKERLNRLKLGTKVLSRNLAPPSAISFRKSHQAANQNFHISLFNEASQQTSPGAAGCVPRKFPVENHQDLNRTSWFSESSTVQDLISCAHPELSVRPIVPNLLPADSKVDGAPPSEYDNLGIYRASTHSSQGTVYSPPWETSTASKLIRDSPAVSTPSLPPAMNFHERIERWQQAISSYQNNSIIQTVNSPSDNQETFHSSQLGHQQLSQSNHELHLQRQQQQWQLLQHQQQLKVEKTMNSEVDFTKTQDIHHQSVQRQQHLQHKHHNDRQLQQHHDNSNNRDSGFKVVPSSSPQTVSVTTPTPTSIGGVSSSHRLSSQCPDVVNCHNTPTTVASVHKMREDDILFGGNLSMIDESVQQKVLSTQMSYKSPGTKIKEYIFKLSGDRQTIFGSTIENFIQCTLDSQETNPQYVMRNVRQFMTGIKNYLVKHGEGELENLIERERSKLGANEILNIDAIIETALHVCVLKPLKYHIYQLFVEKYSRNGALEQLSKNIKYARSKSAQDIGVKPGLKLPQNTDMEVIKHYLDLMQRSYSPFQKLQNLLKATSTIYHCVQGKHHQFPSRGPSSLGADDFLPLLIYVIVHCGLVSAEIEADFMWGLLQPSLLTGEGGYYLTTLSSAVLILKNFQDTHQLAPAQMEGKLPTISDMQGFLKIAIPDELHDSITWKTLPVRPNMNTRDVCAMVAHKFKVTNPQDYGLFLLYDGLEGQLSDSDCPQIIKGDNMTMGKTCYFTFKRLDANIAWPKHMKHSSRTGLEL